MSTSPCLSFLNNFCAIAEIMSDAKLPSSRQRRCTVYETHAGECGITYIYSSTDVDQNSLSLARPRDVQVDATFWQPCMGEFSLFVSKETFCV